MKLVRNILVVCAAVAMATAAMAQGGGRQGGMMMRGQADSTGVNLLRRADVKKEINLTDDQKSKIDSIQGGMREKMQEIFQNAGGDRDAAMKEMQKVQADISKQVLEVLNADQKKRLHEVAIQMAGNRAVLMADIQKELGLTDDQKTKLKDLQTKAGEAMQSLMAKVQNQEIDREEMQATVKKNNEAMDAEIAKVLTDANKAKLKELGGKTFTPDKDGNGGL